METGHHRAEPIETTAFEPLTGILEVGHYRVSHLQGRSVKVGREFKSKCRTIYRGQARNIPMGTIGLAQH